MSGDDPKLGYTRTAHHDLRPAATPQPARPDVASQPTMIASGTAEQQPPQRSGEEIRAGAMIHQYELIRELGRGGMGMVWAARDTRLGRRVAIKFLLEAARSVAERFVTEARATAQCNHDNIIIIHEVGEYERMPYMVLEFLEGRSLRQVIGDARVPASRVIEYALPIARALSRAHSLGIIHRDLKPDNVFVTSAGQVKVLDFGIAKAVGTRESTQSTQYGAPSSNPQLTRVGALIGTLPYMSPEQMNGREIDHRSDLWAFGIMLFEMLAGRHPIPVTNDQGLMWNIVSPEPLPSIKDEAPDVPDGLAAIVDGCLRKRLVERLPNAEDLVRRLEQLLPGRHGRQLAEGESPFPGLTAFQESDANRFFGRSHDIARMAARVRELPITGIVGPSGVGKSSFIRAGVGPSLKASGEEWSVVTLRPGRAPLTALASVLQKLTIRSGADVRRQQVEYDELMRRLRTEPGFAGTLLRTRARENNGHILLFIDQFEELYTLVSDADERRAFTAALAGVADDPAAPLRVVVSMRSDFLDRVAEHPVFMEELSRGLVFLQTPDRPGLRESLIAPLEMVGYRFESEAMVEDMLGALAGTAGALPLLQFAAAKLWDDRDQARRMLTVASYQRIGGISGALATHADEVVGQMNASMQKLTQMIFRRLVTPERTRAIVELSDLHGLAADSQESARAIEQLVAARLLVVQARADAGGGSVEIVHESLIERWPTLRRWLDEDHEDAAFVAQLATAAKQWDAKGRPAGLLWTGDAMEEARRWYTQRPRNLPARDAAFLHAVFRLAQRGKRVRRTLVVGAFAVLASIAVVTSIGLVKIRSAEQQASENLNKMREKESQRLEAEQRKADAEQRKADAEQKKLAAEAATTQANQTVAAQQQQIASDRDALADKAAKLETALQEASTAKERAEREREKTQQLNDQLAKTNAELGKANDKLKKENAELEKANSTMVKKL